MTVGCVSVPAVQATTIGRHRSWQKGDVLGLHFEGQVTEDDLKLLRVVMGGYAASHFFLVADMTDCTGIDAAARKYMADWSRMNAFNPSTVVYGLNFATRAIVMLALNAIKLIGKKDLDVSFVKTEAEALAWVEAQRALRSRESRP